MHEFAHVRCQALVCPAELAPVPKHSECVRCLTHLSPERLTTAST